MSSYYQKKTEANEVLETFAELYLETREIEDYSLDDLDLPDYIRSDGNWETRDEFWDHKSEVEKQIDKLAGTI